MGYHIEFAPAAVRQLKKLTDSVQKRLIDRIEKLAANPRPGNVKKLANEENLYRLPVGDYRVIYQIQDKVLIVLVVKIGHRRNIYR
jgi:mRNA interferase RelE/StbE